MTANLEADDQQAVGRGLVRLDAAARQLGCHIETLRMRIRGGQLRAYRGPHGAYLIKAGSLQQLLERKARVTRAPTPKDLEQAWRRSRRRLGEELERKRLRDEPHNAEVERRWEQGLIKHWSTIHRLDEIPKHYQLIAPFLQVLKADPDMHRALYRLLLGQGLASMGFRAKQVARTLGVSERQARRLVRKRRIANAVFRAARHWAPRRAQRLVDELRGQLQAEGSVFHRRTVTRKTLWRRFRAQEPRPAFPTRKLNRDEVAGLHRAGLSDEQIWAITVVGIGADELNELLLRGVR